MKKNTIFHFKKKISKKDRPKIYIIALDIFLFFIFILLLIFVRKKIERLAFSIYIYI